MMSALAGLIPAHAGKTTRLKAPATPGRAHPRSRGENGKGVNIAQPRIGSSPLTRGKHDGLVADRPAGRLIPAHAGKTS